MPDKKGNEQKEKKSNVWKWVAIVLSVIILLPIASCVGCIGCTALLGVLGSEVENSVNTIEESLEEALDDEQKKDSSLPPKKTSKWQYDSFADDMSGKNTYRAIVKSNNFQSFDFPYSGNTYGTLTLRKHPRYGKDVIFVLDKGQILCHSYSDCSITIRFDEGKPLIVTGKPSGDHSSDTVFLPYGRLFHSIKNSKKMIIEVKVYQEGAPTFLFDTKGLTWKD